MASTPVLRRDCASYAGTSEIFCMLLTLYTICDTLKAGDLSEQTVSVALYRFGWQLMLGPFTTVKAIPTT